MAKPKDRSTMHVPGHVPGAHVPVAPADKRPAKRGIVAKVLEGIFTDPRPLRLGSGSTIAKPGFVIATRART